MCLLNEGLINRLATMTTINLGTPKEQGDSMLCLQQLLMVSKTRHMDMIHENHIVKQMFVRRGGRRGERGKQTFG